MMQVDGVIQRVHIKMNVTSMIVSLDFAHGMRFSQYKILSVRSLVVVYTIVHTLCLLPLIAIH